MGIRWRVPKYVNENRLVRESTLSAHLGTHEKFKEQALEMVPAP